MGSRATGVGAGETHRDRVRAPAFVGRDREAAQLGRALVEPCVVLVEAAAGMGKTRLVQEVLAAAPRHCRFAVGACPPFRESPTLGPIVEAMREHGEAVVGLELTPLAGALRGLFPEWAQQLPPEPEPLADPAACRHRLFRALAELVRALNLTALVVEDAHWADLATVEFLLFVVARTPRPASVVVTYRPEDVPTGSPLLRLSSRLPATTSQRRMRLGPLDPPAAAAMVSSMLDGRPVSEELVRLLHRHTDGVPLALEESVRLLCDRAELVRRTHGWARRGRAELPLPPAVRDAVLERVQRLDHTGQRVLQACAVLVEPAPEQVVTAVAGLTGAGARRGLAAALGCGLLREDPQARLGFRHLLPRQAVWETIPATERRLLLRRAERAVEPLSPIERPQPTPAGGWQRGRRGYGDQLSPRELEVVRLLVTGATNRQIADALSRSPKTVAGQLSSAMRKLDVSSRTALAVAVVDAGLAPETHPDGVH